ncbi:MAG: GNAT family N-acetyltransferase [Lachnospiraceae bacterium]|nr:GNAT family N-acetyltransferase [Lachnospiraceae bacterium]
MKVQNLHVRTARTEDAKELLAIYTPYVEKTAITFEYEAPSLAEFTERIRRTLQKYPYFAAVADGRIAGYAYAGAFKERAAYDWAVETTVYVKEDCRRMGVGKLLYEALEDALALQNIVNLNACIGYPSKEDEYLTRDSAEFHERLGYRLAGTFHRCGYKFNRWYDMIWMEKEIGSHVENQPPIKRFEEIREELKQRYGID